MIFLHGKKDKVIYCDHSKMLYEEAKLHKKEWSLEIREDMDHHRFHYLNDIFTPVQEFINKNKIIFDKKEDMSESLTMWQLEKYKDIYQVPEEYDFNSTNETKVKSWCKCVIF